MKRRHKFSIIGLGVLLVASSGFLGLSALAKKALDNASAKPSYQTGNAFVGMPRTVEELKRCRVFGKSSPKKPLYYLSSEIDIFRASLHESYCFATEADAQKQGFRYSKPPAKYLPLQKTAATSTVPAK